MINTIKNIIKSFLLIFSLLVAFKGGQNSSSSSIMDVSVYNGEESVLLHWTVLDSINVKNFSIYSQRFGGDVFKNLGVLNGNDSYFLDLDCTPGERYFYKIEIEDIEHEIYSNNANVLPFGSCNPVKGHHSLDKNINSIFDLIFKHIKNELYKKDPKINFDYISQLLHLKHYYKYNWLEDFPLDFLRFYSESLEGINDIILGENVYSAVMADESLYRNLFYMTPDIWKNQISQAFEIMKENWLLLYSEYSNSVKIFENLKPIHITSSNAVLSDSVNVKLHIFHKDRLKTGEWYLLSNDEYINLEEFLVNENEIISVNIPKDWINLSLMVDDMVIQSVPIIANESLIYTLEGDIVPLKDDSSNFIKIKKDESQLWINEIVWNPKRSSLNIEIAGYNSIEEQYYIECQDNKIWDINPNSTTEKQFLDSLFYFKDNVALPLVLKLKKLKDLKLITHEYIVLDTFSISMARPNDIGPWTITESQTLGEKNNSNQIEYDSPFVPQLFILYQNYPNPFNGHTRITFDLFEDANISLFVTDASGRIRDRIIEEEFFRAGIYNYSWEGENRSSGIYFITLQALVNDFPPTVLSKKMIYLK